MVERTEAKGLDEFEGTVESVEKVESKIDNSDGSKAYQYEVVMNTDASSTGKMYNWLRIPKTATEVSVPDGSVIDRFIQELEVLDRSLKKEENVKDVLDWMVGKKFRFVRKKLGKAFDGKEAADYWVPAQIIK